VLMVDNREGGRVMYSEQDRRTLGCRQTPCAKCQTVLYMTTLLDRPTSANGEQRPWELTTKSNEGVGLGQQPATAAVAAELVACRRCTDWMSTSLYTAISCRHCLCVPYQRMHLSLPLAHSA